MLLYTGTQECRAKYRGVEQLEARRAHNPEVVGSSPASATIKTTVFQANTVVFLCLKFVVFGNPIHFDPNFPPNKPGGQNQDFIHGCFSPSVRLFVNSTRKPCRPPLPFLFNFAICFETVGHNKLFLPLALSHKSSIMDLLKLHRRTRL